MHVELPRRGNTTESPLSAPQVNRGQDATPPSSHGTYNSPLANRKALKQSLRMGEHTAHQALEEIGMRFHFHVTYVNAQRNEV